MRALVHLLAFGGYALLAGAAVRLAPFGLAELDEIPPYALGALVLLAGGLAHEVLARLAAAPPRPARRPPWVVQKEPLEEEVDWLRREVAGLREALEAASGPGEAGRGGRTVDEVMAEVKVLKSLMERLSLRPGGRPGSAPPGLSHSGASEAGCSEPGLSQSGLSHSGASEAGSSEPGPAAPGPAHPGLARLVPDAPSPADPGADPGDLPLVLGLDRAAILETVREALRNDRVDLVLQPIVSLPQRKRRFYECFSRLRTADDAIILPDQYIAVAERAGLISAIDNMLLFRCVQLIRKIHRTNQNVDFFCNISAHTLADQEFFNDFADFLENNQELAGHLVFEFAQGDFARWSEAGAPLLDRLSLLGCRFSLDQVRDLRLDPEALAERQIRFVKIDAQRLLGALPGQSELMRVLRRRHIDLIVAKVEDEGRLVELLDYDIDFGQGYLFGEPRPARPAA